MFSLKKIMKNKYIVLYKKDRYDLQSYYMYKDLMGIEGVSILPRNLYSDIRIINVLFQKLVAAYNKKVLGHNLIYKILKNFESINNYRSMQDNKTVVVFVNDAGINDYYLRILQDFKRREKM